MLCVVPFPKSTAALWPAWCRIAVVKPPVRKWEVPHRPTAREPIRSATSVEKILSLLNCTCLMSCDILSRVKQGAHTFFPCNSDGKINNPIDGTSPTCEVLDERGRNGLITTTFCMMLPAVVLRECGCALPDGMTSSPTADQTSHSPRLKELSSSAVALSLLFIVKFLLLH
jgi:hypothetical protein